MIEQVQRAFKCIECRHELPLDETQWRCCKCGNPLTLTPTTGLAIDQIDFNERSLWRYRRWLASGEGHVTLGEGWTPLIRQSVFNRVVHWKCDFINPSGSFKDRGMATLVNYLVGHGIKSVTEDSSGNGGASLATYAAASSIPCRIYVPAHTSDGKIAQIAASGAEVIRIAGTRQVVADAAMADDSGAYYASHNWHPIFSEGIKTVGYEIWEQYGFRCPDTIIAPTGGGSNLLGCYRAFKELKESGLVGKIPKLIAVQSAGCEPYTEAFRQSSAKFIPVKLSPTIAEGIAVSEPVRSRELLSAIAGSAGSVLSVSEAEILSAYHALARRGLYVEPTSAAAAAGLSRLISEGAIAQDEEVVVILTGSGLKTGLIGP